MGWRCGDLLNHGKNQVCFAVDSARNDELYGIVQPMNEVAGMGLGRESRRGKRKVLP
jgi:hypothetical protein